MIKKILIARLNKENPKRPVHPCTPYQASTPLKILVHPAAHYTSGIKRTDLVNNNKNCSLPIILVSANHF